MGRPGLEPGANGLKGRCSTIELAPRDHLMFKPGYGVLAGTPALSVTVQMH